MKYEKSENDLARIFLLSVFALILIIYRGCDSVHAQNLQEELVFDGNQIQIKKDSFNLLFNGEIDGSMTLATSEEEKSFDLLATTEWTSQNIREIELIKMNKVSFQIVKVRVEGVFGPNIIDYTYDWKNNSISALIKNTSNGETKTETKVHTLKYPIYERSSMILSLIQALPLKEGYFFNQESLISLDNNIVQSQVRVLGSENVSVPAGEFETYKVEFKTPSLTNIIYITKTSPRFAVKYESVGFPITFELVEHEEKNSNH